MPKFEGSERPVVRPLMRESNSEVRYRKAATTHRESRGATWLMALLLAGVSALLLAPQKARAQEFRGTISGTVTDSSGAIVPGAQVTAKEVSTGTISRSATNAAGQYVLPFLQPGTYSLTVTAKGFETVVHPGIILQSQDHPIINLTLKPGEVSQTVTVNATTPLLDLSNASIGSVISTKSVADLPLNGRTPTTLAELAPGVITTGPPQLIHPFDNNAGNQWSISGTPNQVSEVLLDGAPDMTELGALAYAPTEDSVKEVSIRPFDTDASFGHTIGGVINQVTKGGTNNLHGTLYWFNQIPNLDGNLWFNGLENPVPKLPVTHYNQYGLTVGGPIWFPHVYDGRNKLFFFFAWEGLKDSQPVETTLTVPTADEKAGNFAQTLAADPTNQLYNPFTSTTSGSNVNRTPIPGNDLTTLGVPFNPIALNYLKLFPAPNTTGLADGEDNYISNAPSADTYNNEFGRLDYNASSRDHIFFDMRHNIRAQTKNDYFGNGATGTILDRENFGATLDNVFDLNPTTFFDTRLNWVYFNEVHTSPSVKYTPTSMGFPAYMQSNSTLPQLPYINFGTGGSCGSETSYQCLGNNSAAMDPTTSYQFFTDMVKVIGRHTLKIGFDGRKYLMSIQNFGASSGSFEFNSSWVNSGTSSGVSNIFGGDLAAFMLGLPSNGTSSSGTGSQYDINARGDYHQFYVGTFVQDDWRVNDKLSVNAGLRFDIDTPFTEKLGRTVNGFDSTATINYVTPPTFGGASVTEGGVTYTVPSINTLGGLTFASSSDGAVYKTNSGFFSPRFGFSYAVTSKTVARGGFGIFVMPETLATLAATGSYSSNALSNQEGFSQTTPLDATNDNYHTPLGTLSSPYPGGFLPPVGSSMGASTFLGSSISFLAPVEHDIYSERWNIGVQQQLTPNTMIEALYVGNHGVHLPIATQNLDAMELPYLAKTPWLNPNLEAAYKKSVPNPFEGTFPAVDGIQNSASLNTSSSVGISSLMVPYPQFSSVNVENQTRGQSWFDSGILHLEHRASHGLTLTANYSFSKLIEQDTFLNDEDPAPTRRISPFDHTQHFAAGATYNLPFGRGQMFSFGGGRLAEEIAGGWVINGIYQFQTGAPIEFSADVPLQPGITLRQIHNKTRDTSQNPATGALSPQTYFVTQKDTSTSDCPTGSACDGTTYYPGQYYDHYRTLPQTMSWVRADGYNNLDASILKNFNFSEGRFLQLRFETFNTLNHPIFNPPNVSSPTSGTFGLITSTTSNSLPRQVQLGARIVF